MKKFADFGMSVQNGLGTAHTGPAKLRAAENDAVLASSHIRPRPSYMAQQAHRAEVPPIITLPPVLTRSMCAARLLAQHRPRA